MGYRKFKVSIQYFSICSLIISHWRFSTEKLVRKGISRTNNKAIGQKMVVLKPFYQPASFLRDFSVATKQAFRVAFTFSPVTALAANEGTLSWWL
jgi:hypothetical protein